MRLLLVEDDYDLAEVVTEALMDYNYVVDIAADGEIGWEQATREDYGVILLDINLPKLDGVNLCKRLRSQNYTVPILMMTARDSSTDKVMGLDAGADDYMVKPVDLPELLARIRALLRRNSASPLPELTWGALTLNPSSYEARYADQSLNLTPKEFSLLELFLQSGQRVLTRRTIVGHLWAAEDSPGEEAVKAHIRTLRHKLSVAGAPKNWIETVRGIGYRLNPSL